MACLRPSISVNISNTLNPQKNDKGRNNVGIYYKYNKND